MHKQLALILSKLNTYKLIKNSPLPILIIPSMVTRPIMVDLVIFFFKIESLFVLQSTKFFLYAVVKPLG